MNALQIKRNVLWILGIVVFLAAPLLADGMLVPVDDELLVQGSWAVKYHRVNVKVEDQVATVTIEQEFVNTGEGMIEVEYLFPVPPGAGIDSLTLTVNDKAFAAEMLSAEEARKIYEDIVRRKKDPALLEYAGYGLYRTKAFPLEPGKPITMKVSYTDVCKKTGQAVEVFYPLNTEKFSAKPIDEVSITVDITGQSDITGWYSPTHDIEVEREDVNHIIATMTAENVIPQDDFQMFYTLSDKDVGAAFLTATMPDEDKGYFLLLVSPNPGDPDIEEEPIPKDIILVLDRSGSMAGEKLEQARAAATFIVERLNEGDRFNVISYSSDTTPIFESMVDYTKENRKKAVSQIEVIVDSGNTDIHAALKASMTQLEEARKGDEDESRPAYIIFLTDGLATAGNTREADILADTAKANTSDARLFVFGVGYDVNTRMLDKLAEGNAGASDYVKPEEDVEAKVSSLYKRIKNPVLTDIKVELKDVRLVQMHPPKLRDLFADDQIVLTGRFLLADVRENLEHAKMWEYYTTVIITGKYRGEVKTFEYRVNLYPGEPGKPFIAKLWAIRQVGYLLDQVQLEGETDEVLDELIALSLKYGIVTPYTSFLAREDVALNDAPAVREMATEEMSRLEDDTTDFDGQNSAVMRQSLKSGGKVNKDMSADSAPTAAMVGNSGQWQYEAGDQEEVGAVQTAGNQAMYRKGDQWVAANAADIDLEDEDADVIEIERMSDEYFELSRQNTVEENRMLSLQKGDEPLLIRLRGQAYLIR